MAPRGGAPDRIWWSIARASNSSARITSSRSPAPRSKWSETTHTGRFLARAREQNFGHGVKYAIPVELLPALWDIYK